MCTALHSPPPPACRRDAARPPPPLTARVRGGECVHVFDEQAHLLPSHHHPTPLPTGSPTPHTLTNAPTTPPPQAPFPFVPIAASSKRPLTLTPPHPIRHPPSPHLRRPRRRQLRDLELRLIHALGQLLERAQGGRVRPGLCLHRQRAMYRPCAPSVVCRKQCRAGSGCCSHAGAANPVGLPWVL